MIVFHWFAATWSDVWALAAAYWPWVLALAALAIVTVSLIEWADARKETRS